MLKIFLIILFNLTVIIQQFSAKASDPVTNAAISEGVPFIFKTLKSVKDKVVDVIDNKKEKKEIENLNKDRKITNGELLAYMDDNVSQKASELGRQQNPSLSGDPDKVLISYR